MINGNSSEKVSGENETAGNAPVKSEMDEECKKLPTRIIVRHLPPTMTEKEFLKQTSPIPAHDEFYIAPPDVSLGAHATSRAYITFKSYDDVVLFRDRFNGYKFVDSRGCKYAAMVEIAPFQGFRALSRQCDNEVNTIEDDLHFLEFFEKKKAEAKVKETKLEIPLGNKKKDVVTTTPLLEYLAKANKKQHYGGNSRTEKITRRLQGAESTPRSGRDYDVRYEWYGRQMFTSNAWCTGEEARLPEWHPLMAASYLRGTGTYTRSDKLPQLSHQLKSLKVSTKEEEAPHMQVMNENGSTHDKYPPLGSKEKQKPSCVDNDLNEEDKKDGEPRSTCWTKSHSNTEVCDDQAKAHDIISQFQITNVECRNSQGDIPGCKSESPDNGNCERCNSICDKKSHNE